MTSAPETLRDQLFRRLGSGNGEASQPAERFSDGLSDQLFIKPLLAYIDDGEQKAGRKVGSVAELYFDSSGFDAFCNEGGNVALYEALVTRVAASLNAAAAALAASEVRTLRVLDVGCGSGRALIPVLKQYRGEVPVAVLALEPSRAMLDDLLLQAASAGLPENVEINPFHGTLQELISQQATHCGGRFDLAIATFSISSQAQPSRGPLLSWLSQHAARFVMAEFDCRVPGVSSTDPALLLSPARFSDIVDRYVVGASEHRGSPHERAITHGFLFPAFLGNFRAEPRFTFEQTKEEWGQELKDAYASVEMEFLAPFWWSDCFLFVSTV